MRGWLGKTIAQATARKINRRRKAGPSLMHAVKITRAYYVRNVDQVTCFAHSTDSSRYSQTERSQQGDVCHRAGAGKRWRSGTGFLVPAPAQQCMGSAMETCRSARYPQQCQKRENRRKGREQAAQNAVNQRSAVAADSCPSHRIRPETPAMRLSGWHHLHRQPACVRAVPYAFR